MYNKTFIELILIFLSDFYILLTNANLHTTLIVENKYE